MPRFEKLTTEQAQQYERKESMSTQNHEENVTQSVMSLVGHIREKANTLGLDTYNVEMLVDCDPRHWTITLNGRSLRVNRTSAASNTDNIQAQPRAYRKHEPDCCCVRCGHRWVSRVPNPPACPHCHSTYWAGPRRNPTVELRVNR